MIRSLRKSANSQIWYIKVFHIIKKDCKRIPHLTPLPLFISFCSYTLDTINSEAMELVDWLPKGQTIMYPENFKKTDNTSFLNS